MADYRTLAIQLIASNGKVAGAHIKSLKKSLLTDGKISAEDAEFLTEVRAALLKKSKKPNAKFDGFYLKSMQASLLGDGAVSAAEVAKIGDLILADKTIKNSAKRKFLDGIKKKATLVAPEFDGLYEQIKK